MAVSRVATSSIAQGFPKSRSLLVGNTAYEPASLEFISTITGTGSSGTLTFNSVPAGYTHLQIYCFMKNTSNSTNLYVTFNGDSGANYSWHYVGGGFSGTSITSGNGTNANFMFAGRYPTSSSANYFGGTILNIHDYASTSKYKTIMSRGGWNTGSGEVMLASGNWRSTDTITSITLSTDATYWTNTTQFSLYGIRS